MTFGRAGCVHDTLKLQGRDDILTLAVSILIVLIQLDRVETGGHNDGSVLLTDDLILLVVVDGSGLADLGADAAFSGLKFDTILTVDDRNIRDGLGEGSVDGAYGFRDLC